MKRIITKTSDGSHTFFVPELNEHFHSIHGAIKEAYHVFIKNGLAKMTKKNISILEIGFGTGLNALITFYEAQKMNLVIDYTGIEAFPINLEEFESLNYIDLISEKSVAVIYKQLFEAEWGKKNRIQEHFSLSKINQTFENIKDENKYDLIYFDAFGPRVQPELWTETIFEKMHHALKLDGVLVTYSAKGSVRRALNSVGFLVEKLPGPPGKREMLRGTKCL